MAFIASPPIIPGDASSGINPSIIGLPDWPPKAIAPSGLNISNLYF
jgi:hypothetical protein